MRDAGAKMGKGRWGRSTRTRTLRSGHVVRGHFSMSSRLGSKLCKQAWARALSGAACGVGWGGVGVGGGSVHGTLTSQEAIARVLDRVLHPPTFPGTCSCCCLLPFLEPIVLGPPHQAASWCETKENEHQTDV